MPERAALLPRFVRARLGRPHVRRADRHRDRGEWIEAVLGYRRALEWMPWREDLKVQAGNCLKEFGDHRGAAEAYLSVGGRAHRAEALRQLADADRRAGLRRLPFAIANASEPLDRDEAARPKLPPLTARAFPNRLRSDHLPSRGRMGVLGQPPVGLAGRPIPAAPSIMLDQVGALTVLTDGVVEPLLAGVVAVRARIWSSEPLGTIELWLGEGPTRQRIAVAPASLAPQDGAGLRRQAVNAWLDSARLPPGRHWLSIATSDPALVAGLFVTIAGDAGDLALDGSDAFVPSPSPGEADPARAVLAAPARVRDACRSLFDRPIRSVLALRTDQLGDLAGSLPALARLRELFPDATLTVLVQPPLAAIVRASGIADQVETIDLGYDGASETYTLPEAEERRVEALLTARAFDLAIDLGSGAQTRPLLLLTGATYLAGFGPGQFPFLDYGLDARSRDKANQREIVSHAASVLTLVEGLAAAVGGPRRPVPRTAPSAAILADHGLGGGGHVVLHAGARHAINRWPAERFEDLARRIAGETGLPVLLFRDDHAGPPATLTGDGRVRLMGRIELDAFDAIIAGARLFVGNDSGPKHLAAVRGVPTVSIHVDRLNWNEWGQDARGTILSKRVPCAGCGLNDLALCGREAACIRAIGVDEVMAAVRRHL